jgi:hypothetical protein
MGTSVPLASARLVPCLPLTTEGGDRTVGSFTSEPHPVLVPSTSLRANAPRRHHRE